MNELALFDMELRPEPEEKLSRDRQRTVRQRRALENGVHPLALTGLRLRLHPDAPRTDDKTVPGPRCGTCAFRRLWGEHSYPKCVFGARSGKYPRATHGAATDCRAWWGACTDYAPKEDSKGTGNE